jgi:hypothetical protein
MAPMGEPRIVWRAWWLFASAVVVEQAGHYWIFNDHGELALGKLELSVA